MRNSRPRTLPNGLRVDMQSSTSILEAHGILRDIYGRWTASSPLSQPWTHGDFGSWAGTQEGRDGYDAIEFIAKLPWCNGSVATAGNSWLGRAQWYIAAEQPPSLKCIAPLEGSGDLYREIHVRGGIACTPFLEWMMSNFRGKSPLSGIHHVDRWQGFSMSILG